MRREEEGNEEEENEEARDDEEGERSRVEESPNTLVLREYYIYSDAVYLTTSYY